MRTILLAGLGSPGDINPFIAVGLALKKRDLHPLFLANPYDIPAIELYGIDTVPVGESWDLMTMVAGDPKYLLSPNAGVHTAKDIFVPYSRKLYPATVAAIERYTPAAIISHAFCYGSIWAAGSNGVPSIVAHLAPLSLLTNDVFSSYPAMKRLLFYLAMPLGKAEFNRLVKPLCESLGVPWHKHIIEETMLRPDLLLGLWSKGFTELESMTLDVDRVTCGFPSLAQKPSPNPTLDEFLEAGDAPVVVTLGTNAFAFAGDFFHHALSALSKLGLRAIIISRDAVDVELPDRAIQVPYADYRTLFPKCRAVIHHGGIGVTAETLKAGIPAIVVPFGHDQEDNGLRVGLLGTGKVISRSKTRQRLAGAIEDIISAKITKRANALGGQFREEMNGADYAAEYIFNWLATDSRKAAAG